jgi:glutaredoxin
MMKLFRTADCPGCRAIEEILEELCIAHEVVSISQDTNSREIPPEGTSPPVLVDGEEIVQGSGNIISHLEKLEEFRKMWYKFQSDACYCDEMD